jgi:hypothetical protein
MKVWTLAAIGLVAVGVAYAEDDEVTDDDLDLDSLDDDLGPGDDDMMQPPPQIEEIDFDKDMPEPQRKDRMKGCLGATQEYIKANPQMAEAYAKQITTQAQGKLKPEQAWNYVVFNMMMMCYQQITEEYVEMVKSGGEFGDGELEQLFSPPQGQQPKRAGESHVKLWEKVAQENAKDQQRQQRAQQSSYSSSSANEGYSSGKLGDMGFVGQSLTGGSGLLYVLGVFAVIFGIVTLVILKTSKPPDKNVKYQSSKSIAKKEKADAAAAKKAVKRK